MSSLLALNLGINVVGQLSIGTKTLNIPWLLMSHTVCSIIDLRAKMQVIVQYCHLMMTAIPTESTPIQILKSSPGGQTQILEKMV